MSISQDWLSPPGWMSANSIDAWNPSIPSSPPRYSPSNSLTPVKGSLWENYSIDSPLVAPPELSSHEFLPVDNGNAWEPIDAPSPPQLSKLDFTNLDTQNNEWDPPLSPSKVAANLKRNSDIEAELNKQSLYKTEMCRSWVENGLCRYGAKCQFAHGQHELRPVLRHPKYKTEICKTFHSTGTCPYGKRCRFIHHSSENPPVKVSPSFKNQDAYNENHAMESTPEETELVQEIGQRLAGLKLSLLAPDPVFNPVHLEFDEETEQQKRRETQKKGSRLPFFQKLRNKKH